MSATPKRARGDHSLAGGAGRSQTTRAPKEGTSGTNPNKKQNNPSRLFLIGRPPGNRHDQISHAPDNPPTFLSPTSHAQCNTQPKFNTSSHSHPREHQSRPLLSIPSGNADDQPNLDGCTGPTIASALPTAAATAAAPAGLPVDPLLQVKTTTPHAKSNDGTLTKMASLATCSAMRFSPSTKQLLEKCKSNRGEFLRAIKEARVTFPTGQGWEAAIATKKENADIRDLMRIYHRFECYNIYTHVVEAGFHTGSHWIRESRLVLANKLCHHFPDRFKDQKTANKSLNWVDQGCRYHEWAEALSETSNLGYLIALPSDISHSA